MKKRGKLSYSSEILQAKLKRSKKLNNLKNKSTTGTTTKRKLKLNAQKIPESLIMEETATSNLNKGDNSKQTNLNK